MINTGGLHQRGSAAAIIGVDTDGCELHSCLYHRVNIFIHRSWTYLPLLSHRATGPRYVMRCKNAGAKLSW